MEQGVGGWLMFINTNERMKNFNFEVAHCTVFFHSCVDNQNSNKS